MANATRDTSAWKISAPLGELGPGADITKTLTISTAGSYVDKDIEVDITASVSGTEAAATVEVDCGGASATVKPNSMTAANGNAKIASAATTTAPETGYYVAATAATAASTAISFGNCTKSVTIDTAGHLSKSNQITIDHTCSSGNVTGGSGPKYYIPLQTASLDNKATTGTTYTENTSIVIPSEGALYINEGYTPAIKITLDQMLDGKADTAGTAEKDIRTGKVAYDVDGKKLTGSMGNATIANGAVTHSLAAPAYNSETEVFDQTCKIAVAAPTVTSAGYISSTDGTKTATAEASNNHSLAKIVASVSAKPAISKTTVPSGVTDASAAAATTTAPTKGVYVAVNTAEVAGTTTVATAGYGTQANNGITGKATAADTAYVKIKEAVVGTATKPTASATGSTASGDIKKITLTAADSAPTTGRYIKVDATAGKYNIKTAGWIGTGDKSSGAATSKYYTIADSVITANNITTQTTENNYYINLTEGYTDGGKVYVSTTGLSESLSSTVTQDAAHTNHTFALLDTAPTSGPYAKITGTAGGTTKKILTESSKTSNKYLKIFDGAYTIV